MDAIKKSNDLTYGYKMTIFLAMLVLYIGLFVVMAILSALGSIDYIGWIFYIVMFAVILGAGPIFLGMQAYVYKTLAADA